MDEDLIINPNWSDRRQNRCAAFRFLFQWEMNQSENLRDDLSEFISKLGQKEEFFSYAVELIDGVIEKKEILDSIIRDLVTNWDFSRVAKADLAILRLSLYEIIYRLDVPPVVAIDEALELGKEFSSENSGKFLNGVLDKARKQFSRPARKPAV
ncbi:MAG: transcription antitermination factor NusB [Verrucomicrobiota bacterium]|nr:transcription antitermination factor NusB [Verrucomicrobiota bacterium]